MTERPGAERLDDVRERLASFRERLPTPITTTIDVGVATYQAWRDDRTIRLGAGLAYYGLFSLASVFSISLWMVQVLSSRADVENFLATALEDALGDAAPDAATTISNALDQVSGGSLGLVGLVSLLITGSLFFLALEDALNQIWGVPVRHGIRWTIRRRLTSFLVLFGAASAIILSVAVQAVTSLVERIIPGSLGSNALGSLMATGLGLLVLVVAVILLLLFLPSADVSRRAAIVSGVVTAGLLVVGTALIGWYLRTFGATSVTGAAASILAILFWIFYEAQILLAGAQLSKVLTLRRSDG